MLRLVNEKFPMLDREGCEDNNFFEITGICHYFTEDYQVFVDLEEENQFYVVCKPELRKEDCWNVTQFCFDDKGNLEPVDDDVELDPYHMCLFYQLVNEWKEKKDG